MLPGIERRIVKFSSQYENIRDFLNPILGLSPYNKEFIVDKFFGEWDFKKAEEYLKRTKNIKRSDLKTAASENDGAHFLYYTLMWYEEKKGVNLNPLFFEEKQDNEFSKDLKIAVHNFEVAQALISTITSNLNRHLRMIEKSSQSGLFELNKSDLKKYLDKNKKTISELESSLISGLKGLQNLF